MVALPNPSFEPKTHQCRPGAGATSREVASQNCAFCAPKTAFFGPKRPRNSAKTAKRGANSSYTSCAPQLPRDQEPFIALELHDMSEKRPKKAPKSPKMCAMCINTPKPSTGRILGFVAQNPIPRAPSPPATPQLLCSTLQNCLTIRLDSRTSGHLVEPEGSPARAQLGPTVGPPGSLGRKKDFFPKLFLDHLGCSRRCF